HQQDIRQAHHNDVISGIIADVIAIRIVLDTARSGQSSTVIRSANIKIRTRQQVVGIRIDDDMYTIIYQVTSSSILLLTIQPLLLADVIIVKQVKIIGLCTPTVPRIDTQSKCFTVCIM